MARTAKVKLNGRTVVRWDPERGPMGLAGAIAQSMVTSRLVVDPNPCYEGWGRAARIHGPADISVRARVGTRGDTAVPATRRACVGISRDEEGSGATESAGPQPARLSDLFAHDGRRTAEPKARAGGSGVGSVPDEPEAPFASAKESGVSSDMITFALDKKQDRDRLRGWIDNAPRLMSNGVGALTDFWRETLIGLLNLADHLEEPHQEGSANG